MLQIANKLGLSEEVASQTIAVLGIRGSGKTNTAGVLVEELFKCQRQIVVVDPTDAHWGYRLTTGRKPSGLDIFVFGGEHGDLPLREQDGKSMAEILVEERISAVLSLRHLRKAAQRRFVTELAEELYHLKGITKNRTPLTVVIDEAPLFVPQQVTGESAHVVGAIEDLVARGRNAGFGIVLISQRAATINKNVLSQSETIICHRLPAPQDKKALREWFEENASAAELDKVLGSLAKLKDGEAWVWSPRLEVFQQTQIRLRQTYDSSFTPKPGVRPVAPPKLSDIDLSKLEDRMAEAVRVKQENDPVLLKKQIKELHAKLDAAAVKPAVVAAPAAVKPLLTDKQIDRLLSGVDANTEKLQTLFNDAAARMAGLAGVMLNPLTELREKIASLRPAAPIPNTVRLPARQFLPMPNVVAHNAVPDRPQVPRTTPTQSDGGLPRGEARVLTAVLQFGNPTRTELTVTTGFKRSTRDAYIQRLREKGFVMCTGETVTATTAGEAALPDFVALPTGEALQQHWLGVLPKGEKDLLAILLAAGGETTSEELSEQSGFKRSTRDAYLQRMDAKRIITRERGTVKIHAMLQA